MNGVIELATAVVLLLFVLRFFQRLSEHHIQESLRMHMEIANRLEIIDASIKHLGTLTPILTALIASNVALANKEEIAVGKICVQVLLAKALTEMANEWKDLSFSQAEDQFRKGEESYERLRSTISKMGGDHQRTKDIGRP